MVNFNDVITTALYPIKCNAHYILYRERLSRDPTAYIVRWAREKNRQRARERDRQRETKKTERETASER